MSSCLCKKLEGAVFPFQVEALENGIDDPIHALDVDEADHGAGSAPDFHEAALNDRQNIFRAGPRGRTLSGGLARDLRRRSPASMTGCLLSFARTITTNGLIQV
jgi:hypothetical protein